jgi:hypothetical protein
MEEAQMSHDERSNRDLIRHGMGLFVLGLLTGFLIPSLTSPRLALAAHVEGLLNGMFLILVGGVVWKALQLPERVDKCDKRVFSTSDNVRSVNS